MTNLGSPIQVTSDRTAWENPFARVRWSAVWAGLVAATGMQIVLAVLGAAVGFSALGSSARGVGIGVAIWALIVLIVTLFAGGMIAGRLAGVRSGFESFVHGTLVWALSLMLTAWLVGSTAGSMFGGALNLVGNLTGSVVSAAGQIAGPVAGQAAGELVTRPGTVQSNAQRAAGQIRNEAEQRGITGDSARVLADSAATRMKSAAGELAGNLQGAATGSSWMMFIALVLAFMAAWLGARWAMPRHPEPRMAETAPRP